MSSREELINLANYYLDESNAIEHKIDEWRAQVNTYIARKADIEDNLSSFTDEEIVELKAQMFLLDMQILEEMQEIAKLEVLNGEYVNKYSEFMRQAMQFRESSSDCNKEID